MQINPQKIFLAGMLAALLAATNSQASLSSGMIAYWPLDTVAGTKTPDVVSGYDMNLQNLTVADLAPGEWNKAFKFDIAKSQIQWATSVNSGTWNGVGTPSVDAGTNSTVTVPARKHNRFLWISIIPMT